MAIPPARLYDLEYKNLPARIAGIAGEEPGHVFRIGQRGGVQHDAA